MEIAPQIAQVNIQDLKPQQELKPMKGAGLDADVQRFEHLLFDQQSYQLKGPAPTESMNAQNAISKLGDVLFDKVQRFKQSIDQRINRVDHLLSSPGNEMSEKNLLEAQAQISHYSLETTLISQCGDKVSQGIQTLFRNQ